VEDIERLLQDPGLAETNEHAVLAGQINVPAPRELREVAQWALAAPLSIVQEYYYRGDSACH
jgi:hypothetical protein